MSLESHIHPLEHLPHHDTNEFSQAGPHSGTDIALENSNTEASAETSDHSVSDDLKNNDMDKGQAVEGTSRTRKLAFIHETGCHVVLAEGKKKRGRPFGSKNKKPLTHHPETDTEMEINNETHPGSIPRDDPKNNDKDKGEAIGGTFKKQKLMNIKETGLIDPTKKKPRGRPLGSKNKPKPYSELSKSKKASKDPSNKWEHACESDTESEVDQLMDHINEPCADNSSSPSGSPSGSPSDPNTHAPPQQALVKAKCSNVQQFLQFCKRFEDTSGDLSKSSSEPFSSSSKASNNYIIEIVDDPNFVLQIPFFFHWKWSHIERLNMMLQKVRTLHRLDLKLGTEDEINANLPKYLSSAERHSFEVTRTTCCPSSLMKLIHQNPRLSEIRLCGVEAFFKDDIVHIPDMHHLRVLEMDVAAWVPETRRRPFVRPLTLQEVVIEEMYLARFKKFLQGLQGLERLILHCPERPGAFMLHLTELEETMPVFAEARTRQQEQQHSGFTIRLQAPDTNSTFEIVGLNPQGCMTDVHVIFNQDDDAENTPTTSCFAGLFNDHAQFRHVTRLIATNPLPVWCIQALGSLNVEITA